MGSIFPRALARSADEGVVREMKLARQRVVDSLRAAGYQDLAEQAAKTLPDPVDSAEVVKLCDRLVPRDELISLMGGSP
jgi:hypothetical protein